MGILNAIKGQLIDVIEWSDNSSKTMVHKYDMNGKEIMMGAQLTVRESQVAIFVNEGELADVFEPGRYELQTSNMPILTALKSWKYGFNSPFKSDVYFVNTKQFLDMKWGTSNPVMMRDAEFGMIRVRAFGIYSFRVSDAAKFLKEVFGTAALFTVEGVEGQIKRTLVSGLSDAIAESKIPALDLAANYEELSAYAMQAINPKLAELGLTLCSFVIENISLPEEVEKSIDKRTSMGVLGNMDQYAKYQAAEAIRDAANNQNGMAGMGVGMGAGAAMGQMFTQSMNPSAAPAAPAAAAASAVCSACGAAIPAGSKFCPECGAKQAAGSFCGNCGTAVPAGTKFCPECGTKL
ncbi:SPFH domain-containing protein [Aristaeella hokkaidonensis]|uniref:SPFH domain-containing protein n=1 Tax=Aristaeella hokkaidonensis TaxID=3046382 RepID=A0AC61N9S4_9FIRM|nr:SPFH domain-containing protein [Aristaeella hokkaidonensis]QUC68028.1 SPFH domain-containing protein [Aristaeella hokkaidonensis]SNT93099.1 Membrane protease subunit, stomatin/prohibitin family, contains C-terminal Zn-ribbon domain [Aristaeella hokkaidonensis]